MANELGKGVRVSLQKSTIPRGHIVQWACPEAPLIGKIRKIQSSTFSKNSSLVKMHSKRIRKTNKITN